VIDAANACGHNLPPICWKVFPVSIHPLAEVNPAAEIGSHVRIGPFCVVEAEVTIGDGCILESHVVIKAGTTLGNENRVCDGAVLGGLPQHVHVPEFPGRVLIGDRNTFRENVTVHRALERDRATVIGNDNLLMVNAHVAHDCHLGNHAIVINNVLLGGHVTVGDRAYLGGASAVHQFCRIGTLATVGGQAHIVKDVPPYVTVDGLSSLVVGLNQIGCRRAGFDVAMIRQLKQAYRVMYRSGLTWNERLAQLQREFPDGPAAELYRFLTGTTRGATSERRPPPGATIKFRRDGDETSQVRIKAG